MTNNYKRRLNQRRSKTCQRVFNYMLEQVQRDGRKQIYDRYDDILIAWMDELIGAEQRAGLEEQMRMEQKARLHSEEPDPNI